MMPTVPAVSPRTSPVSGHVGGGGGEVVVVVAGGGGEVVVVVVMVRVMVVVVVVSPSVVVVVVVVVVVFVVMSSVCQIRAGRSTPRPACEVWESSHAGDLTRPTKRANEHTQRQCKALVK